MITGTRCDKPGTTTYIPMEEVYPIVGIMVDGGPNHNSQGVCESMLLANAIFGEAVDKVTGDKPPTVEARVYEAVHHALFLRLESHHDGDTHHWTIYHVNPEGGEGAISSGTLANLLTVWESLCEGWRGDAFDGIG